MLKEAVSGVCVFGFLVVVAGCTETRTDRVGDTRERPAPSASPGTTRTESTTKTESTTGTVSGSGGVSSPGAGTTTKTEMSGKVTGGGTAGSSTSGSGTGSATGR